MVRFFCDKKKWGIWFSFGHVNRVVVGTHPVLTTTPLSPPTRIGHDVAGVLAEDSGRSRLKFMGWEMTSLAQILSRGSSSLSRPFMRACMNTWGAAFLPPAWQCSAWPSCSQEDSAVGRPAHLVQPLVPLSEPTLALGHWPSGLSWAC